MECLDPAAIACVWWSLTGTPEGAAPGVALHHSAADELRIAAWVFASCACALPQHLRRSDPRRPRPRITAVDTSLRHLLGCALALLGGLLALPGSAEPTFERKFVVRLDDRAIGTHRFAIVPDAGGGLDVTSEARFDVKVLGWTAYRYRHQARERWSGDCMASLDAATDDDGRLRNVRVRRFASGLHVQASDAADEMLSDACAMTFAYWNPRVAAQRRLLDPATGRMVSVHFQQLPATTVTTDRGPVQAVGWRISGLPTAIDIWWADDRWIGLDTVVRGRRLTYRLQ